MHADRRDPMYSLSRDVPANISRLMSLDPSERSRVRREWVQAARSFVRRHPYEHCDAEHQRERYAHLARALAALAFNSGGVTHFGHHWEASDHHALYSFTPQPHDESVARSP